MQDMMQLGLIDLEVVDNEQSNSNHLNNRAVLMSAVPGALADTTTTTPLTPGYDIWHGSRYVVCPPGVPAPCANHLPNDFNNTFWKIWGGVPFISGR